MSDYAIIFMRVMMTNGRPKGEKKERKICVSFLVRLSEKLSSDVLFSLVLFTKHFELSTTFSVRRGCKFTAGMRRPLSR